jgi:hypothetical protein
LLWVVAVVVETVAVVVAGQAVFAQAQAYPLRRVLITQ